MIFASVVDEKHSPLRPLTFGQSTPTDLQPLFDSDDPVIPAVSDIFLLCCMCFMSFFCHYNAPRYYMELKHNTVERFSCVSNVAFGVSAVICFVIRALGYHYTVGQRTDGFILNVRVNLRQRLAVCS